MRIVSCLVLPVLLFCIPVAGQPTLAPTNAPLGTARGDNAGAYNYTSSFETGYRFHTVNGNYGKYRSDVNFRNGVRLLGGNFTLHSLDGHGSWLDELAVNTQGLGNDPYQFSAFRLQKNRIHRYDLIWRQNDYYNPALTISQGAHFMDTSRRLQDHSIVLLPQSRLKLFAGFARNTQSGPALSTSNLFDVRTDEFTFSANTRRSQEEYRIGNEITLAGLQLSWMRFWEYFKDDTTEAAPLPTPGFNTADLAAVSRFYRAQPYHGRTASWRANLRYDRSRLYTAQGRFTYAAGRRRFIFDELLSATDRFGIGRNRQILVTGDARRPVSTAALEVSVFPIKNLTVANQFSFHHTRMEGDGRYAELSGFLPLPVAHFQFLAARTFSNSLDINWGLNKVFGLIGGYQVSSRRIRSREQTGNGSFLDALAAEQSNLLHAALFGVRTTLSPGLTAIVDAEIGRADRPFYPTGERKYHLLGGRIRYRSRTLQLGAQARANYNFNSFSLAAHSSKSRNYTADASWSPRTSFGLDVSYSKLHLDTLSALAYFLAGAAVNQDRSVYISNIHSATAAVRWSFKNRLDFFIGYSRIQDTADGRDSLLSSRHPASLPSLTAAQVFPLDYHSPFGRISLRLTRKLRWNAGYQRYVYSEEYRALQNYRAHTGYASLSWAF